MKKYDLGFDLDPVLAKLMAYSKLAQEVNKFGIAQDYFNDVIKSDAKVAVFLIPRSDSPGTRTTNCSTQVVTTRFDVVIALRNYHKDGAVVDRHRNKLRALVADALLGWQPEQAFELIIYTGGALREQTNATTIWGDEYLTKYLIASADKKGN